MKRSISIVAIMIYTILALFLFILIWAYLTKINVVIRVQGKVEPFSSVQIIEHLEGGVLKNVLVDEGDHVKEGDLLAVLDRKAFESKHKKTRLQRSVLKAEVARLKAESNGWKRVKFPDGFAKQHPKIAKETRELFKKNKDALASKIRSLKKTRSLVKQELEIIKPLVDKQVLSKVEELRLKRRLYEIEGQIETQRQEFTTEAHRQLMQKQAELNKSKHSYDLTKHKLDELKIRAPKDGIIKTIHATAKGSVIQPGEKVMELVPLGEHPIISAKIKSRDLGYIKKGLKARVTFSAQSMTQYATVPAELTYISPDSERNDDGNYYYTIKLKTLENEFKAKSGDVIPIQPGMSVTIAVKVGKRSVLASLLTPLFRTMESVLTNP